MTNIVASFVELCQLADFKTELKEDKKENEDITPPSEEELPDANIMKKFSFSYTINLNLPATTDQRVYNTIFKSLKDNLFK